MDRRKKSPGVRARGKSIQIDFTWSGIRFRERINIEPTPANIAYASRKREAIRHDIEKGSFSFAEHFPDSPRTRIFSKRYNSTIGDALDLWLKSSQNTCALSSWMDYRSAIEFHLKPQFGSLQLVDLTSSDVKAWIGGLLISSKRISNVLTPLRGVFEDAFNDGLIASNPLTRVHTKAKRPDDPDPLDLDEQEALLTATREPQIRNLFQFAFWTGLRPSEYIALRWEDVDVRKGIVRVQRARVRKQIKGPKTNSGYREVKLLRQALEALELQKTHTYLQGQEIFFNPRLNERWSDACPIRKTAWLPTLKRAGIRARRLYETRHTYASVMLTAGEDPFWVSRQMGHQSLQQTLKAYARWIPNVNQRGGDRVEEILAQHRHNRALSN